MTGEQLKTEIKKRGFTFKEVAERLGQTATNLSNKLGKEEISTALMEEVAAVIGCNPADFYRPAPNSPTSAKLRENEMLRSISVAAMQGLLVLNPFNKEDKEQKEILKTKTPEQCIAELSVRQAMYMVEEFKKNGIDK